MNKRVLSKPIKVSYLKEANEYIIQLPEEVREKIINSFRLIEDGAWVSQKIFKKLTDDIWEFKESDANYYYRIFAFWDKKGKENTLILCTHGIEKKTDKTPPKEIHKADEIRKLYFKQMYKDT